MTEFFWAALENLQIAAMLIAMASAFLFIPAIIFEANERGPNSNEAKKMLRSALCVWVPCFLLICTPTYSQMLKIRIQALKYYLASPENAAKAEAVLERIGQKLEEKYLGTSKKAKP